MTSQYEQNVKKNSRRESENNEYHKKIKSTFIILILRFFIKLIFEILLLQLHLWYSETIRETCYIEANFTFSFLYKLQVPQMGKAKYSLGSHRRAPNKTM